MSESDERRVNWQYSICFRGVDQDLLWVLRSLACTRVSSLRGRRQGPSGWSLWMVPLDGPSGAEAGLAPAGAIEGMGRLSGGGRSPPPDSKGTRPDAEVGRLAQEVEERLRRHLARRPRRLDLGEEVRRAMPRSPSLGTRVRSERTTSRSRARRRRRSPTNAATAAASTRAASPASMPVCPVKSPLRVDTRAAAALHFVVWTRRTAQQ